MIHMSRHRYYDGYEIARLESQYEDNLGMAWNNTYHISIPSAPNPDKYERKEFMRSVPSRLVLYGELIARSRLI